MGLLSKLFGSDEAAQNAIDKVRALFETTDDGSGTEGSAPQESSGYYGRRMPDEQEKAYGTTISAHYPCSCGHDDRHHRDRLQDRILPGVQSGFRICAARDRHHHNHLLSQKDERPVRSMHLDL